MLAVFSAVFLGCGGAPTNAPSAVALPALRISSKPNSLGTVASQPKREAIIERKIAVLLESPSADDVPEDLHPPKVVLSSAHAATCLIKQGDTFPSLTLPDMQGNQVHVASAYGDRLTVVVFWSLRQPYARDQFSRLQSEVFDRYRPFGVSVVAINEGDAPADVLAFAKQSGVTITCLQDPAGSAFQKVASSKLPRTYLLDAGGAVLWFDIEYSLASRRELNNAIHWALRNDS